MAITDAHLQAELNAADFNVVVTTGIFPTVKAELVVSPDWRIIGYADGSAPSWDSFDLGLARVGDTSEAHKGTVHRCFSDTAVSNSLLGIIASLRALAATPDKLRCPKCGLRWVHMKEPYASSPKQWPPFLSCDGMQIAKKRMDGMQFKEAACKGTSKAIPALVKYT